MSTHQQYVIEPPDIPLFLFSNSITAWEALVEWANEEFQARTFYLIQHGYMRELNNLNINWSPVRILAEMSGYRRMCSKMNERLWNELKREHRRFITSAFELRELLFRQSA